jgi:hypothetical protein
MSFALLWTEAGYKVIKMRTTALYFFAHLAKAAD